MHYSDENIKNKDADAVKYITKREEEMYSKLSRDDPLPPGSWIMYT